MILRFYNFGMFQIDVAKRLLRRDGEPVALAPKTFDMLLVLVEHGGQVLDKDRLMELLWPDSEVEEANLPQNISALRKAPASANTSSRFPAEAIALRRMSKPSATRQAKSSSSGMQKQPS